MNAGKNTVQSAIDFTLLAEESSLVLNWTWKHYDDLSKDELHDCFVLRQEVFVVEQECAYQDADTYDKSAWHLLGHAGLELAAYLRILPQNSRYPEVSIGRVVTARSFRSKGHGRELTQKGMECIESEFGNVDIRISAQVYLEAFYAGIGFSRHSKDYLEDGIPHVEMIRRSKA